jgi:hypothetical protein
MPDLYDPLGNYIGPGNTVEYPSGSDNNEGFRSINDATGLNQSEYDFNYRVFPSDLTNNYLGHYMVININVPVGVGRTSSYNGGTIMDNEYSKVDYLRFDPKATAGLPVVSGVGTGGTGGSQVEQRELAALGRSTRRIKESIALYMPSSIVHTSTNRYEEVSLTALAGKGLGIALEAGIGLLGGVAGKALAATGGLGTIINQAGKAIGTVSKLTGRPINPRVEVLFSTTDQRQFVFEVLMAPRNEQESQTIRAIVQTLRYHSAPEIGPLGLFWIPPAEFDITFYNKGVENVNIPRVNTCVMERIEVDYSPTGVYSTFRNGHPVAVRLSMSFREIEVLHKQRILQGF